MNRKLLKIFLVVVICAVYSDAVPAYPQNNFNSWDTQVAPQQAQAPRRNNHQKSFQSLVREHIGDVDKDKQTDLKVLSYFEKEVNKIFSCYLKLSCYKTRSAKVLAECDEIKDWPLYHQVMKMAGIEKYPYKSYAPARKPLEGLIPSNDDEAENIIPDEDMTEEEPEIEVAPRRNNRQANRFRRNSKHHQH